MRNVFKRLKTCETVMETDLSVISEKLKLEEQSNLKNPDLIADVAERKLKFVTIIESLGNVLTNEDVAIRVRGVDFLSWILTEIPPDLFNAQEIMAVTSFYSERLKDNDDLKPAIIKGLLALVKMKNMESESIKQFLIPLFNEISYKPQQNADLSNILSIIEYLLESHFKILAEMGSIFVVFIMSLLEHEADPSNLLLFFQFFPVFLKKFDLGDLTESMFLLLSGYLPIDFLDPEKNELTLRNDLADGLARCLISRPDFSEYCIPFILTKLKSTSSLARIDSYRLLGASCGIYPVDSICSKSDEIWECMLRHMIADDNKKVSEAALYCLTEIVMLFDAQATDKKMLIRFLDNILRDVGELVATVEDNPFQPAMNILLSVSKSLTAADYVLPKLKPVFSVDTIKTPNQRRIAISSLRPFLPIVKTVVAKTENPDNKSLFDGISQFYLDSAASNDREIKKLSLLGLQEIASDFDGGLCGRALKIVADCIKKDHDDDDVRKECLCLLRHIGEAAPNEVLQFLEENFNVKKDCSRHLMGFGSALSAVADVKGVTQYAVPQMLNIVTDTVHFQVGLCSLANLCKMVEENPQFLKILHDEYKVTERLVSWWMAATKMEDCKTIECMSEVIALIVRHQETSVQQSIADKLVPLLLSEIEQNPDMERNVIVIEAIIGSVRSNIRLENFSTLNATLLSLSLRSNTDWVRTSASRLLASILNKSTDDCVPTLIELISKDIWTGFDSTFSVSERSNATQLITWMVKGLLLANSSHSQSVTSKWLELLDRDDVGEIVADGFRIVLRQESLFLCLDSHSNIKILYRQRFCSRFPMLMKKFREVEEPVKRNYLLAIICLVEGVPKHAIADEAKEFMSVVIQALRWKRQDILVSSLGILNEYLVDRHAILEAHAMGLVPILLELARYEGSMKVRMNALRCLQSYTLYPVYVIFPMKNEDIVKIGGYTYDDGTVYVGGWNQKGQKHGFGRLLQSDGTIYEGSFSNGLCSGLGVMNFPDGSLYEGEFMQGWFHGHGVFWRSDGMKYEGEFRGGRVWGLGLVTFNDRSHGFPRYEGFFQDCRLVRKKNCPDVVFKAQKISFMARNLASDE